MAKKTFEKKGAEAPKVENTTESAPKTDKKTSKATKKEDDGIVNLLKDMPEGQRQQYLAGLDPNRRMDLIRVMHETFRTDPMAASHTGFGQEAVNSINKINAAMQVGALVCELVVAKNPFTALMPATMVEAIKQIGGEVGVHLNTNLLPAPDKDGNIEVPSKAIELTKEAKKAATEEAKVLAEKPETNPEKIQNEEELKKAAQYVLADAKTNIRPYDRLTAGIELYRSWLYFQATDDAAKEEIKSRSRLILLQGLIKILGKCPYSIDGIGKLLFKATAQTKSPISAFSMFRNSSLEKATGRPTIEDSACADFVKSLVTWNGNSLEKEDEESIEICKQNIDALSKNAKQNAAAIEKEKTKIEGYTAAIETYKEVIGFVTNPEGDLAKNLPEIYNDPDHPDYAIARRVVADIFKTYYPGVEIKSVEEKCLLHNVQQYIGVILNFFRDPMEQLKGYSEGDITELVLKKTDDSKGEKKAEKEPSKN